MDGPARTIAITGATGFVGRRVVKRLLRESDIVLRCLVRPMSDTRELERLRGRVALIRGDVCEPDSISPLVVGAWGVINLAGYRQLQDRTRLSTLGASTWRIKSAGECTRKENCLLASSTWQP